MQVSAIQTSPKQLAQPALFVTLNTTLTTSLSIVKMSKVHGMAPQKVAAMKDCIELLSDSVHELQKSLEEMSRPGSKVSELVMSNIQTWVSSALTDKDTCSETTRSGRLLPPNTPKNATAPTPAGVFERFLSKNVRPRVLNHAERVLYDGELANSIF
ncbi:putative pectinesterase [Helianthus annuus]|nr:putative pectinesterase [Helianthus annuus]KAJ0719032.1 putative pectinesterase [Helianthus annuus]KAJ0901453.1 putative pectinesterase [Helianthus annuus]